MLVVQPIVEGHGEQRGAAGVLLTRIRELCEPEEYLDVLRPIRQSRGSLASTKKDTLERAVELVHLCGSS